MNNLELAKRAVFEAQKVILKYYNKEKPKEKDIDLEVELKIKEILSISNYNFDEEESGKDSKNSEFTWFVDPIACSMNFLQIFHILQFVLVYLKKKNVY